MRTVRSGSLAILAALVLLTVGLAGCLDGSQTEQAAPTSSQPQASDPCRQAGWTSFEHSSGDFSLCHPDDWVVQEELMGAKVALVPEEERAEQNFAANLNVYAEQVPEDTALDTYVDAAREQVGQVVTDVEMESSRTIAADPPTHEMVYTGQQGVYELRWQQRIVLQDGVAYVLTFTADASESGPPTAETVDAVFGSFSVG